MSHHVESYQDPIPTVDLIVRKDPEGSQIVIERRGRAPFVGKYALPGGHVDYGELVEHAALRELKEECAISASLVTILGVYSDPKRDPRGQRISTVFIADYKAGEIKAGDDAGSAEWIDLERLLKNGSDALAFDHQKILRDYSEWRKKQGTTFWSTKEQ
jgi:ADP-ribose pyrophosphatase YjhB (NUDIX family)